MKLRTVVGPAILVAWAAVLGFHVRREYFKSSAMLLTEGARSLAPGRFWYAVKMNETTIGFGSSLWAWPLTMKSMPLTFCATR